MEGSELVMGSGWVWEVWDVEWAWGLGSAWAPEWVWGLEWAWVPEWAWDLESVWRWDSV